VRQSAYRIRDLKREVARGNWELSVLPIVANGVTVDDRVAGAPMAMAGVAADEIPYLGDPDAGTVHDHEESGEIWGDDHFATWGALPLAAVAAAGDDLATLAQRILESPRITLATEHVSGVNDQATVRQNIADTAAGALARRSNYGGAPGGTVALNVRLLRGLLALAGSYSFSISELVGGSHSPNSRHYAGVAADVNQINGSQVRAGHPDLAAFKQKCRDLGATEVLGPGAPGHDTHVHAAWPRP
jgi:hypothetical protein